MIRIIIAATLSTSLGVFSCQKRNFNGDNAKQEPVNPEPNPPVNPPTPPTCEANTTITVKALTQVVDQYAANPIVEYQIDLNDCPGTTPVAKAEMLQFDIDAVITNRASSTTNPDPFDRSVTLPYQVVVDGVAQPINGIFDYKSGQDLFGKTGQYYGYFQTDQKIEFPAEKRTAKLTINIQPIQLLNPANNQAAAGDTTMSLDTFFKFGASDPVKVPVSFTRKAQ